MQSRFTKQQAVDVVRDGKIRPELAVIKDIEAIEPYEARDRKQKQYMYLYVVEVDGGVKERVQEARVVLKGI